MAERVDYTINAKDSGVTKLLKGIGTALDRLEKVLAKTSTTATQVTTKMQGFVREGQKIKENLETPLERYNRKLKRTNELLKEKAINEDIANRRKAQIKENYKKETIDTKQLALEKEGLRLKEKMRTENEKIHSQIKRTKFLQKQRAIDEETALRRIIQLRSQLNAKQEAARARDLSQGAKVREANLTGQQKIQAEITRTNILRIRGIITTNDHKLAVSRLNAEYAKLGATGESALTKLVGSMAALNIASNGFRRIFETIKADFAITAKLADKIRGKQEDVDVHTLSKMVMQSGLTPTQTTDTLSGIRDTLTEFPVAPGLATGMAMQTQIVSSGFADKGDLAAFKKYAEFFAVLGETNLGPQEARELEKPISKFMSAAGAIVEDGPDKGKMDVDKMDSFLQKFAAVYANREIEPHDLKEIMSNMAVILNRTNGATNQALAALVTILEVSTAEQSGTQLRQLVDTFANLAGNTPEAIKNRKTLDKAGIDSKQLPVLIKQGDIQGALELVQAASNIDKDKVDLALDEMFGKRENKGIRALLAGKTKLDAIIAKDLSDENVSENYRTKLKIFKTLPSNTANRLAVDDEYQAMNSLRREGGLTLKGLEQALFAVVQPMMDKASGAERNKLSRNHETISQIIKYGQDNQRKPSEVNRMLKMIYEGQERAIIIRSFEWAARWNTNNLNPLKGSELLKGTVDTIDGIRSKQRKSEIEVEKAGTGRDLVEEASEAAAREELRRMDKKEAEEEASRERVKKGIPFNPLEIPGFFNDAINSLKGGGSSPDRFPVNEILMTEANPNKGALLDAVNNLSNIILDRFPKDEVQKVDVGIDASMVGN